MAHFAEVNSSNEVLRVVVISNTDVDANGGDQHADAETFVTNLLGHEGTGVAWKQTSFNHNFRKQYASIGMTYDRIKDKFINPKPYASWALDANDDWQPPVNYPADGTFEKQYEWDEDTTSWKEIE